MQFAITLLTLALSVFSKPSGAPKCIINEVNIEKGMGTKSDPALGYSIDAVPGQGNTYSFTVKNTAGRADFQGVLMYVTSGTDAKAHFGKFTLPTGGALDGKFKFHPACAGTSTGPLEATVTHANPKRIPLNTPTTFTWTGTAEDIAKGNLQFNAVIASLDPTQTGKAKWQKIQPIPLVFNGQGGAVVPGGQQGGQQQGGQVPGLNKVIKCLPRGMIRGHSL
ncbi:hypothetical protein BC833DRAFT_572703 [Globomyces pollinis-pini]|nr:hypothetical protein BC833DRAFT_572703 [Globomyces pollinis-pini]KAJ2999947.1 hypothetical protein HDV02_001204 [Globomyces sp. JEL0801]